MWEKDDLANIGAIGEQHDKTVDAHAKAAVGGHAVAHGAQVVIIHGMALFVIGSVITAHFPEAGFLVQGIVELSESVAQLKPGYKSFEALDKTRITRQAFRQGRDIPG